MPLFEPLPRPLPKALERGVQSLNEERQQRKKVSPIAMGGDLEGG